MGSNNVSTNIRVVIRVRPLLQREIALQDTQDIDCLVNMPAEDSSSVTLKVPELSAYNNKRSTPQENGDSITESKKYRFDECIWSYNNKDSNYTNNKQFYHKMGPEIIDHFFQGFNVCLLAYGQTSSGKTFTMMGNEEEPGLIPLIIRDILRNKERLIDERINCQLRFSYMEIYNEHVKDLLSNNSDKKCKIREHPINGPYVEDLVEFEINDYQEFVKYLMKGNVRRSTASTSMNDSSSRSHAIIKLSLKQTKFTPSDLESDTNIGDEDEEMISSITLVDLAGSERLSKTKVFGQQDRMKEGTLINKSLTVLGRCINVLSKQSSISGKPLVVPYRDSVLTYILKENLAGNSKTFMVFCVSPIDFEETYQTLNYANQVKMIKTAAKANKTKLASTPINWEEMQRSDQSVIDSLKDEIKELTNRLNSIKGSPSSSSSEDKFASLITYLERESNKLKFENVYLKHQLAQKSHQAGELTSYITYIEQEFNDVYKKYEDLSRQNETKFLEKTKLHIECIEKDLLDFDPKRIL